MKLHDIYGLGFERESWGENEGTTVGKMGEIGTDFSCPRNLVIIFFVYVKKMLTKMCGIY